MQTGLWMAYSDSMHFFEQFSYKILLYFELPNKRYEFCKINTLAGIFTKKIETGPDLNPSGDG
jgi:hypothetical protein